MPSEGRAAMLGHDSCRWTRPRLPLLAGGELTGDDRRRTERHVITCEACRQYLDDLGSTLNLLHLAGDEAREASAASPSLWPALQRQVRETKRTSTAVWNRRKARALARVALAASLLLSAGGLGVWAVQRYFVVVVRVEPRPQNGNVVQPRSRTDAPSRRFVSRRREVREPVRRDSLFDEPAEPREPLARGSWPEPRGQDEPTH